MSERIETKKEYMAADRWFPMVLTDVHEIVEWEETKEFVMSRLREQAK